MVMPGGGEDARLLAGSPAEAYVEVAMVGGEAEDIDVPEREPRSAGPLRLAAAAVLGAAGLFLGAAAVTPGGARALTGTAKELPSSWDDLMDHIPLWAFLLILACDVIPRACNEAGVGNCKRIKPSDDLQFFCCVVLWPILNGGNSSGGSGCLGNLVWAGCVCAFVAAILNLLDLGRDDIHHTLAALSGALVVVGILLQQGDQDFWSALPFWAWAISGLVYYIFLLLGKRGRAQDAAGAHCFVCWLMIMYAALGPGKGGNQGRDVFVTIGCICGILYTVVYAVDGFRGDHRRIVGWIALACLWVPLCWDTFPHINGDTLVREAPFLGLAITLFVCIVCEALRNEAFKRLMQYTILLMLYTVLWKTAKAGRDTNWDTAADIGCLIGLFALLLDVLGNRDKLHLLLVAETICVVVLIFG
eukprot:TRINITY_DN21278_c0_g1_i1.p1 TRINITY_DN21278_c0_g1~~TRINITY_DN21278_c0_g1_i1.p1  ORF type:complete len:442 (+),score=141.22 TRINITY_DN21278_c0_g1_i1:76-1326(+)